MANISAREQKVIEARLERQRAAFGAACAAVGGIMELARLLSDYFGYPICYQTLQRYRLKETPIPLCVPIERVTKKAARREQLREDYALYGDLEQAA